MPIYQTTSYTFDDTQHGADLFDLKVPGNIYTRIMNPTTDVLEQRLAALEGGIGALALASGMSAVTYAIQTIAQTGDNIVSISKLYGGTYNLFAHTFPKQGIEVRMADHNDLDALASLIDDNTKAVFCESIGNPLGNVVDIKALADVAHAHGVPLIVDNTVPTPILLKPIALGADIVVHALTKAFLMLQGLETLSLRMERHCENTQAVAEFLENHEQVSWVNYAGLPSSPDYELAQRQLGGKASGILSFGIKGGQEAGAKFIDALQLILRLVNIGDAKSLACHPASTTHRQLNDNELATAGVSRDMIRLSIGIEHIDDIIADLSQALAVAK